MYDDIVDDIYDPKIEKREYQALMRSVIKAWIRDAVGRGVVLGREDLALELDMTIKKAMDPGAKVIVYRNRNMGI